MLEQVNVKKGAFQDEPSTLVSKNVTVGGKRTSIRLEPEMWLALTEIANRERCSIHDICTLVANKKKPQASLTSAIRVFLMLYYRSATTEEGHMRSGHGNFSAMQGRALNKDGEVEQKKRSVFIKYSDHAMTNGSSKSIGV